MTAAQFIARRRALDAVAPWARRNAWTLGLVGFLGLLLVYTKLILPSYDVSGVQNLAIGGFRSRLPRSPRRSSSSAAE